MATAILFLPAAATACPAGWTPSPASATCFFVPPERSTSLFRCVDLCEEYGGTPACIGSAEENNFVTAELAVADDLWLGLYQNETGSGPAKGWGRCVAGDAPSFTNWLEGQPDDYRTTIGLYDGYQQDCAWFDARTGQLRALACDASVYSYPFSCLCARGNASAAFSDDLVALKATRANNQQLVIERDRGRQRKRERLLRRRTRAFAAAIAVAILPTLLLLGRAGWRRLRRGADAQRALGARALQPRPHDHRRRRLSARPRALLASQRSRECCARRETRTLGGGCTSALPWCRRGGRYRRSV